MKQNAGLGRAMGTTDQPEQPPRQLKSSIRETERPFLALIETEIEVAFSFLRMAEAETSGGNGKHATELIAKAIVTHNAVLQYLGNMRMEFEAEKQELCIEARKLFEAIRASERRRRRSGPMIGKLVMETSERT